MRCAHTRRARTRLPCLGVLGDALRRAWAPGAPRKAAFRPPGTLLGTHPVIALLPCCWQAKTRDEDARRHLTCAWTPLPPCPSPLPLLPRAVLLVTLLLPLPLPLPLPLLLLLLLPLLLLLLLLLARVCMRLCTSLCALRVRVCACSCVRVRACV